MLMAERHMETHEHGEASETAVWCCVDQIPQNSTSSQIGRRGHEGIQKVNKCHQIVVLLLFKSNSKPKQSGGALSDGCGNMVHFMAHNLTSVRLGAILSSLAKLRGLGGAVSCTCINSSNTNHCTGPSRKIIQILCSMDSIQNRSVMPPDLIVSMFHQEEKAKYNHMMGTFGSTVV